MPQVHQVADDLIAAPATPSGAGGIGVIRLSGRGLDVLANRILHIGKLPPPRLAVRARFLDADGAVLDDGLCLYFPAPHSFTGQDMLELHGHGGDAVLQSVLSRCLQLGARLAEAGEFSLRAYLNDKLDLAQAEALADLITAADATAAKAAARSLRGEFSKQAHHWADKIESLRADIETRLDFSDEDISVQDSNALAKRVIEVTNGVQDFRAHCERGAKLASGTTAILLGPPNVGKSSIMNRLCEDEVAIVDASAGTTRDLLVRNIVIGGLRLQLTDTAGMRSGDNAVERAGIERAAAAINTADVVIIVRDGLEANVDDANHVDAIIEKALATGAKVLRVRNKIDIAKLDKSTKPDEINISAKTGAGIDALRRAIVGIVGLESDAPPSYTARTRHVAALDECLRCLAQAKEHASQLEICAAWLMSARQAIESLTGKFDDEQLLGDIFSRFCIGK